MEGAGVSHQVVFQDLGDMGTDQDGVVRDVPQADVHTHVFGRQAPFLGEPVDGVGHRHQLVAVLGAGIGMSYWPMARLAR